MLCTRESQLHVDFSIGLSTIAVFRVANGPFEVLGVQVKLLQGVRLAQPKQDVDLRGNALRNPNLNSLGENLMKIKCIFGVVVCFLMLANLAFSQTKVEPTKEQPHSKQSSKPSPAIAQDTDEDHASSGDDDKHIPLPKYGVAVFQASKGSEIKGTLNLAETPQGLHVWGEITGLAPGEHGFHIHEFGDARGDDGMATGGHFSSEGHEHADLKSENRHEGDFGNVVANDKGVAKVDVVSDGLKLHFVLGRAFVVHADKDDLATQPSGNAGKRIGVALIGVAKAPSAEK